MECFTADFAQFASITVNICVLGDQLGTRLQFQVFR